jgi:hypothetical protein
MKPLFDPELEGFSLKSNNHSMTDGEMNPILKDPSGEAGRESFLCQMAENLEPEY